MINSLIILNIWESWVSNFQLTAEWPKSESITAINNSKLIAQYILI